MNMNRDLEQQYHYRLYCSNEQKELFLWNKSAPTQCPIDASHTLDTSKTEVIGVLHGGNALIHGHPRENTHDFFTVRVNHEGEMYTHQPLSAFGAMKVQQDYPLIQLDFIYGIDNHRVNMTSNDTGYAESDRSLLFVHSGTGQEGSMTVASRKLFRYAPGVGANIMFAGVFDDPAAGNTQLIGVGSVRSGLFFGYNGADFGVMRRYDIGQDTWVPRTEWNIDKMDGTGPSGQVIVPQFGNVFRIVFQWLGFGMITFMMENTKTGEFISVHRIEYANMYEWTSMRYPSFPMHIESTNTTNTSDVVVKVSSFSAMSEGVRYNIGRTMCQDNTKAVSRGKNDDLDEWTNLMVLRNKTNINATQDPNYIPVFMRMLSCATDGNAGVVLALFKHPQVTGLTDSWTDIHLDDSVIEYNTSGSDIANGNKMMSFTMMKEESRIITLTDLEIDLSPGESMCVAAKMMKKGASDISVSVTWIEDR